jgi:hypothetical protein
LAGLSDFLPWKTATSMGERSNGLTVLVHFIRTFELVAYRPRLSTGALN